MLLETLQFYRVASRVGMLKESLHPADSRMTLTSFFWFAITPNGNETVGAILVHWPKENSSPRSIPHKVVVTYLA